MEVRSIQSDEVEGDRTDAEADQSVISRKNSAKALARGAFELGETIGSLFFMTSGAVFAIGLFLNLNGYGYRLSSSEGIRIDTLDEMKLERQFERNSVQNSVSENTRPTSASQMMQFFYRQPFTASLILTGVALTYEEVVQIPRSHRKQEEDEVARR